MISLTQPQTFLQGIRAFLDVLYRSFTALFMILIIFFFLKVGWLKQSDQTILTLHKRVITNNARIHVTHDEQRTWNLLIKNVQAEDEGCYMCQINTAKMKKELGCISVLGKNFHIFQ